MNEPEVTDIAVRLPLDLHIPFEDEPETATDETEPATAEQDDLCHGKVPENVWYCSECKQYFDHRVTGPHPKPVREEEETPIPTKINRAMRRLARQMQRQEARQEPQQLYNVGVCRACMKPFIGQNRCQCKTGKTELVMVQAVRTRGRAT